MALLSMITQLKAVVRKYRAKPSFAYQLSNAVDARKPINIIYVLHASTHKAGGDKVIYKQSQIINEMFSDEITSTVLHPENMQFQHHWFEHKASFKKDLYLDPNSDFVVIPEIWAVPHGQMLHKLGIKYAIFVQNGYSINIPLCLYTAEDIKFAYENASIILTISEDTSACIILIFPSCTSKIQRVYCSVDVSKFKPSPNKENLITYMPRKLARHSDLVISFINNRLPSNWKMQAIDGLSELGVIALLNKSKIFLSFSEFEGLGLPPIEAALTGNFVIGYTGEGAKEYWESPIFTKVATGDIRGYVEQILSKVAYLNQHNDAPIISTQALSFKYSVKNENESLTTFVAFVRQVLNR